MSQRERSVKPAHPDRPMDFQIGEHDLKTQKRPLTAKNRMHLRAVEYSENLARKICERIMTGEGLNAIFEDPMMPSKRSISRWLADPRMTGFRNMYYMARRVAAEIMMDEILDIADDNSDDWVPVIKEGEVVGFREDKDAVARSRLRVDTRKWLAAKMLPHIYGDITRHHVEAGGDLKKLLDGATNNDTGPPTVVSNQ